MYKTLPKYSYSTLFGTVTVEAGTGKTEIDNSKQYIESALGRELGIFRKVMKNDRIIQALENPTKFLEDKNARILKSIESVTGRYKETYERYVSAGYGDKEAESKAMEAAKKQYEEMITEINTEYPKEVTRGILSKLGGKKNKAKDII